MSAIRETARQAGRLLAASIFMLLASFPAWPQAHTREYGGYTIRTSSVGTENLSAATASEHGIKRDPRRAILNITVMKKDAEANKTVPASVQAYVRNLAGQRREIDMREISEGGRVSYMGTYDFIHGEVLDFIITARPEGSNETLNLTYRDRMWAKGDLPDVPPQK